ncbi:MAG: 30S ribosomal protein S3ae [Methanoculleaceae archaeon]
MARKKQVGRRLEGWRSKSWYTVHVPEIFGQREIGMTVANDPEKVVGRVMETTLSEVTQDFSKAHIKMRFKINRVAGDAAYTDFVGHETTKDYLRSLVKRHSSRVDAILPVVTKDGKRLRLTATAITLNRANAGQAHEIRKKMAETLKAKAADMDFNEFTEAMVTGSLARDLFKEAKTIFPIRRLDIIKSRLENPVRV